jgi:hypothetical protein
VLAYNVILIFSASKKNMYKHIKIKVDTTKVIVFVNFVVIPSGSSFGKTVVTIESVNLKTKTIRKAIIRKPVFR